MVGEPEEIQPGQLVWDDENRQHVRDHGVEPEDVEAVLANRPRFFRNLPGRRASHVMIGPNSEGRFFFVAFVDFRSGNWRVVTAFHYSRQRALRYYKEPEE